MTRLDRFGHVNVRKDGAREYRAPLRLAVTISAIVLSMRDIVVQKSTFHGRILKDLS